MGFFRIADRAREWMVHTLGPICIKLGFDSTMRDKISLEALFVKVIARSLRGGIPMEMSHSTLDCNTRVFPEPAPAIKQAGEPTGCSTANVCSSFSCILHLIPCTDSGVYSITNVVTGKRYIGSACNFRSRWKDHRTLLLQEKHHSPKLQNSWRKHGPGAFC